MRVSRSKNTATRVATVLTAGTALLALVGCGSSAEESSGDRTTLTVLAAASLTSTFQRIADHFEAEHPGTDVRLSFGGSSDLASQIQNGAPADVFASADTATMAQLAGDGLTAGDPEPFATNTLEIAVPPGDPADVHTLADLSRPGLRLVVCAPQVPCGAAARRVAQRAGVTLTPVSEEQSVTDVLAKVTSGEADAGLVYVTDVRAAGDKVQGIPFRESSSVVNTYPIAVVADSAETALARDFVAAVTGHHGRRVLRDAGFGTP